MKTLSLFSGCLGLDLGLEAATGAEAVAYVEQDEHCLKVIRHHRPDVRVISDVRNIDQIEVRRLGGVEFVAGGFPCQDLSYAGRGAGLGGDRSGLWFEMLAVVERTQPRLVLIENVPGLLNRGLGVVLHGLVQAGYVGRWFALGAVDVGAPHRRMRVFVTARRADVSDAAPLTGGDIVGLYDDAGWVSPQESLLERETITKFPKNGRWTLDAVYGDPDGVDADESVLLPTPSSQESQPTDEFVAEIVEQGLDPEKRLYLPGRKWHVQRTLSRVVPATMAGALLPTPGANDGNGGEGATRAARQETGKTGGAALRDLPHLLDGDGDLLPTPQARDFHGPQGNAYQGKAQDLPAAAAHVHGDSDYALIPTPSSSDAKGPSPNHGGTTAEAIRDLDGDGQLLPTTSRDHHAQGAGRNAGASQTQLSTLVQKYGVENGIPDEAYPRRADDEKLLPTPVVTDSFGSRRSTARTDEWQSNPGTTLTDAIWETQGRTEDTTGKLLPTPKKSDAKGADVARSENRTGNRHAGDDLGTGGELRAAVVHGEGRRNETGVDTLGRPNDGRPSRKEPEVANRDKDGHALLPTPTAATGGDGERPSGFRRLLGPEIRRTQADDEKLLPTPNAQNSTGGQSREMRASRGARPYLNDLPHLLKEEEAKLLPTPAAAEGGYSSRGGDRQDEMLLGGIAKSASEGKLLPTPQKSDGDGGRLDRNPETVATGRRPSGSKVGKPLATAIDQEVDLAHPSSTGAGSDGQALLPTPNVSSSRKSRKAMVENRQWTAPHIEQALEIARGVLPREFQSWDEIPGWMRDAAPAVAQAVQDGDLEAPPPPVDDGEVKWGVYEPAIRRWENTIGRAAPAPTDEKGRLSPAFVGWMMGMPDGWVDVPGVKRTAKLRMLGNAVQVQVGYVAGMAVLELDRELAADDPAAAA